MKIADFEVYRELLLAKSGLVLTPDKSYLLDSRLTPVARKWGYPTLDAMGLALRGVPDSKLVKDVVEAMTTNETSFFRDQKPFDHFKDIVLPHMLKTRAAKKKIRVWCAASSSGQESYSLCMMIREKGLLPPGWTMELLATDINDAILESARKALYTQFEVQRGLPIQYLMKYFSQQGDKWQLSDEIRKMVRFEYFNLLNDMKPLGNFDVILCRNVLIYFDEATKTKILERMSALMPPDGFLMLGGAETVFGITEKFKPMPGQRGVYIMTGGAHEAPAAGGAARASAGP